MLFLVANFSQPLLSAILKSSQLHRKCGVKRLLTQMSSTVLIKRSIVDKVGKHNVISGHNLDVQKRIHFYGMIYILAGNVHQLIPCVSVVVFGLFSPDDQVKPEHYFFGQQECRLNFLEGDSEEMLSFIIKHFSQPGNMILDITGLEGRHMSSKMPCFFLHIDITLVM